jgi:hypothetical protein
LHEKQSISAEIFRIALSSLPGCDTHALFSRQSEKYPRKSESLFKWFDYNRGTPRRFVALIQIYTEHDIVFVLSSL